ncbi:MAG: hypothetical protein GXO77_12085 [Calditrichaeota bacterium]|nr:hypothetical protein [Calditrichota bacterium]
MKSFGAILFLIFISCSRLLYSQDIGIYGIKAFTDNYELRNPSGTGAFISIPLNSKNFRINFDYIVLFNKRTFTGRVISDFLPPEGLSQTEKIKSNSQCVLFDLSFLLKTYQWKENSIYLGLGFNTARFSGQRKGLTTGMTKELWETTKFGISLGFSFIKTQLFTERLNLIANMKYRLLNSGEFATDAENTFFDQITIFELQAGLSYRLR